MKMNRIIHISETVMKVEVFCFRSIGFHAPNHSKDVEIIKKWSILSHFANFYYIMARKMKKMSPFSIDIENISLKNVIFI